MSKLQREVRLQQCCCVYALLNGYAGISTSEVARALHVTSRALRYRRRDLRLGKLTCKEYLHCARRRNPEIFT